MKRLIALALILMMCLGMTACGASEDEKAFEEANALLDSGDYEGALEKFYSIGLYNQTAEKIYQIEEQLRGEKVSFLTGTWKDLNNDMTLTFGEKGKFTVTYPDGTVDDGEAWFDDNDQLYLFEAVEIREIDGVTHMTGEYSDWVSEADYEVIGPRTVEITLDNWADYFEIRETDCQYRNDFGEIEQKGFGFGVFLKDDVASKLRDPYESVNVSVKVAYDEVMHKAIGSVANGDFQVGEVGQPKWMEEETRREEAVGQVWLQEDDHMEGSGCYGCYCANFTGYTSIEEENDTYIYVYENPELLDITGTLVIFP